MKKYILISIMLLSQGAFAENYYDQFKFGVNGTCEDIHNLWFKSTNSWENLILDRPADDKLVVASLSLQLFDDLSYWASYSEMKVIVQDHNSISYEILFTKTIEDFWRVDGDQLYLQNLGSAVPTEHKSYDKTYPAFKLVFDRNLNHTNLKGNEMVLSVSQTNVGPRGISMNEYCGIEDGEDQENTVWQRSKE